MAHSTPPHQPLRRTWSQMSLMTLIKKWTLKAIKAITILPTNSPMQRVDPNSACTLPGAGLKEYCAAGENFHRYTERKKHHQIDSFYNKQRKKDVFSANSSVLASLIWLKDHGLYLIICKLCLYNNQCSNWNIILHPVLAHGGGEGLNQLLSVIRQNSS